MFCSHGNQVEINPLMTHHVSSEGYFSKVIRLVRKTFSFCKFCDFYVKRENRKSHESTRDQYENAKVHSSHCNRPPNIFCSVCEIFIPKSKIDRLFL